MPQAELTLGAYTYRTQRIAPASGEVTLAEDPFGGYPNVLRVNITDRFGNDRTNYLNDLVTSDVIASDPTGSLFPVLVTGTPSSGASEFSIPFDVRRSFVEDSEPDDGTEITLFRQVGAAWPTTDELAQVLNVDNVAAWQETLDRVLAAAIAKVKSDSGWDEATTTPTNNQSQAALRMAELISTRPDSPANDRDQTYLRLLTGQRRRFGIA